MSARTIRSAAYFIIASGFVAGITQVLLIRELLQACFGNEIALGLTLAAWLVCGAVGVILASRWRPRMQRIERTVTRAIKLAALLAPALFFAIVFARVYHFLAGVIPMRIAELFDDIPYVAKIIRVYIAAQPGEMLGPLHILLISVGTAVLPAVIIGGLFTVGLKAYEQAKQADPAAAGQAYGLDAIGHLLGGVLLGWAAVTALNPLAVCCGAVALLWLSTGRLAHRVCAGSRRLALLAVPAMALLLVASVMVNQWSAGVRWHGRELLDQVSSVYGHIAVARQGDSGVVFFENGVPTGVSPGMPSVEALVQFSMLQHRGAARVLLIGGGATSGLVEVLKHGPIAVDHAEIDPAMVRFSAKWVRGADKEALADPRVRHIAADGRLIVKQAAVGLREKYDVIIVSLPDPSTALLNRFYTQGWFREAHAALTDDGVLGWQISSSRHYFKPSLLLLNSTILRAADASFTQRALMPGEDTLTVVLGNEGAALSESYSELDKRMRQRRVMSPYFSVVARDWLDPYNKRYVLKELAKCPPVRPNDDQAPIGYYYHQAAWLGLYFSAIEDIYLRMDRLSLAHLVLPGLILLGLLLLAGIHRVGRAGYVPLALLVTGGLGMALELCILFAFQSYYGYVYRLVGVIIGAFMVGLAAGAMWAARRTRANPDPRAAGWCLAGTQVVVALFALGLPAAMARISASGADGFLPTLAPVTFALLTSLIGLAVGVQFPLATLTSRAERLGFLDTEGGQARAAAILYAADLLGASVGAATMGAIFIPVLGIPQTCLAALCISGAMALLLAYRALLTR